MFSLVGDRVEIYTDLKNEEYKQMLSSVDEVTRRKIQKAMQQASDEFDELGKEQAQRVKRLHGFYTRLFKMTMEETQKLRKENTEKIERIVKKYE